MFDSGNFLRIGGASKLSKKGPPNKKKISVLISTNGQDHENKSFWSSGLFLNCFYTKIPHLNIFNLYRLYRRPLFLKSWAFADDINIIKKIFFTLMHHFYSLKCSFDFASRNHMMHLNRDAKKINGWWFLVHHDFKKVPLFSCSVIPAVRFHKKIVQWDLGCLPKAPDQCTTSPG